VLVEPVIAVMPQLPVAADPLGSVVEPVRLDPARS
jgi:hypothetical protein